MRLDEGKHRFEIAAVVAGLVDGGFGDESSVGEAGIVEETAEGREAEGALADVLMAIEMGTAGGLRVVHVPDADIGEPDRAINEGESGFVAVVRDEVVAGDVAMASIEAGADGDHGAEAVEELGDLLEAAAEGELGAGSVFDEDAEVTGVERDAMEGAGDAFGGAGEADFAGEAFPGAGMEDEVFGAEGQGAFDFAAKGGDGLVADGIGLAGEVDEIAGVDDERAAVVLAAEGAHLLAVGRGKLSGAPHAGTGREDLEGVGAQFMSALSGAEDAAGSGEMNADAGSGHGDSV